MKVDCAKGSSGHSFCFMDSAPGKLPTFEKASVHSPRPKKKRGLKQEMEAQEQAIKSRVVKVDSEESWDFFINQANNQGCPVAVHFTASWCAPSVAMKPCFEEMALSYPDILFLSVDVDEVKTAASKLEVKAMPTFVLLKDAVQTDKLVGANPEEIRKRIDHFALSTRSHKQA